MKLSHKKCVFRKLGSFLMAASLAMSNFIFTQPLTANAQGSGSSATTTVSASEFITSADIYDSAGNAIDSSRIKYVNASGVDLTGFGIGPSDLETIRGAEDKVLCYVIKNSQQFLKFATNPSAYPNVILKNDINFSTLCTSLTVSENKVTANVNEDDNVWLFKPIDLGPCLFDGRGYTIDGLVVHSNHTDLNTSSYVGVFSDVLGGNVLSGVEISSVQFGENCQVVASYSGNKSFSCGAIAGRCEGVIKGCGWYGSVYCYDGRSSGDLATCGCLVGYQSSTDPSCVTNCFIGGKFRFASRNDVGEAKAGAKLIDAATHSTNILHPDLNVAALANVTKDNIPTVTPNTSTVEMTGLTSVTEDQIKSGEACYLLNGKVKYNNPADGTVNEAESSNSQDFIWRKNVTKDNISTVTPNTSTVEMTGLISVAESRNSRDFIWRQNVDNAEAYDAGSNKLPTPSGTRAIANASNISGEGAQQADSHAQYYGAVFRIGYNDASYYTNNFYKLFVEGVDDIGANGRLAASVGSPLAAQLLYIDNCPDKYKRNDIEYRWYFEENATNIVSETAQYTVAGDKAGYTLVVEAIDNTANPNDNVIASRIIDIAGDPQNPDTNSDKEVNNGTYPDGSPIINYERSDGSTAAFTRSYGEITWVKERSGNAETWYGLQDSERVFTEESTFWVKWINKDGDPEEWEKYYDMLDEEHKKIANSNMHIFMCGVTSPEGKEYTNFGGKSVKLYVQLGGDWDKEKIQAVFLKKNSNGEYDEAVTVEFKDDMKGPDGKVSDYAILTLKHFSPYAVFDSIEEPQDVIEEEVDEEFVATGDNALTIVTVLLLLMAVAGLLMFILKKQKNKPATKK